MTAVNPFLNDPDRGSAWEDGYEAGFAEPEVDHLPPLEAELLEIFSQGEKSGRDDRRMEPASQTSLPSAPSGDFSRFEAAPDGTLIPVPDEGPQGNPIRGDAEVTVNAKTSSGYYAVIFNGPPESRGEFEHVLTEITTEAAITQLEHMLAHAAGEGAKTIIKFGGLFVSVVISVFTPSPILKESRFRGYLPDQTPIAYVVLDPQH
jgi:hypothetical protein